VLARSIPGKRFENRASPVGSLRVDQRQQRLVLLLLFDQNFPA
jgi:hypothetical protein